MLGDGPGLGNKVVGVVEECVGVDGLSFCMSGWLAPRVPIIFSWMGSEMVSGDAVLALLEPVIMRVPSMFVFLLGTLLCSVVILEEGGPARPVFSDLGSGWEEKE